MDPPPGRPSVWLDIIPPAFIYSREEAGEKTEVRPARTGSK